MDGQVMRVEIPAGELMGNAALAPAKIRPT
jgi:hypothetical protein